jgi:hypothetical protein
LVASESATQSVTGVGGADAVELRQPMRDCGSHSPNHGIEGGDCCGGGRVNEGPTCCTGKAYWSAAKKACDVDQYEALPMDGSKEDDQAGCTGKPYWGVAKKGCGVDQYGAPPMDRRVGARGSSGACKGASGYDRAHGALTRGSDDLKGGEVERWSSHG